MAMTTALAVTAVVASTAAAAYSTDVNYKNAKAQQKMAKYNQKVAESNIRTTNIEKSMAVESTRDKAIRSIASGRAAMTAAGNVGPTADTSVLASYLNLDKDLSTLDFNYDTKVASLQNQAAMFKNEASTYGANAVNALVGGGLNTTAAFAKGMYSFGNAEGWWTPSDKSAVDPSQVASANNMLK